MTVRKTERDTRGPVARLLPPVQEFINREASGGIVLLAAAVTALIWANSPLDREYFDFWASTVTVHTPAFKISDDLQHWVNNGLMTLFFFVVALEIKREVLHGELSGFRRAALPVAAALGGMAVPALLYAALNAGGAGGRGWGIPMATDTAFALAVLALLGNRLPSTMRVFLLALAIADDVAAILVIAVFYSGDVDAGALVVAAALVVLVVAMQRAGVRGVVPYGTVAVALWIAVHESGVHATISGVVLGLLTPSQERIGERSLLEWAQESTSRFRLALRRGDRDRRRQALHELRSLTVAAEPPLERLERVLHPWSAYLVLPVFALANADVALHGSAISEAASSEITLGVIVGLIAGKVVGVSLTTWLATRLSLAELPRDLEQRHVIGMAILAGVGFTVSIFIAGLAFNDPQRVQDAKIGILAASVIAATLGYCFLRFLVPPITLNEVPA